MSAIITVLATTEAGLYGAIAHLKGYKIIDASKRNFTSLRLATDNTSIVFDKQNLDINHQSGWIALAEQIQE